MKKTRNTRQRGIILEILRRTHEHPTAEMIYRDARRALPNISLGTVYRNLNFLRDHGAVRPPCRFPAVRGTGYDSFRPPSAAHFSSMSVVTDFGRSRA